MAMGSFDARRHQAPLAEINMVPMVDVMLVLLVLFIITAPLFTHSVKIDLPRAASSASQQKTVPIEVDIRQDGTLIRDGTAVTPEDLAAELTAAAATQDPPELHIHGDRLAHYEYVAQVMSLAARAGIERIGFITDPATR
jgi:biopolymer transport protein ExbD